MPLIKRIIDHRLVLDTHIWIWLMTGEPALSSRFIETVIKHQQEELLLVSAISIWEVGMLVEKKRISLSMDCLDWVERSLSTTGIHLVPLSPRIAIQSTRLPGTLHGDPADRMLIATAYEENAVLVTHDQKLLNYGRDRFISVYDPCE